MVIKKGAKAMTLKDKIARKLGLVDPERIRISLVKGHPSSVGSRFIYRSTLKQAMVLREVTDREPFPIQLEFPSSDYLIIEDL